MKVYQMLLWLLYGVGVIFLFCFASLWLQKRVVKENYDERQQIARGRAYQVAYYVGLLWTVVCVAYISNRENADGMPLMLFLGFEAQLLAFYIYCLLTHSALPLSQKPGANILGFAILTLFYVCSTMKGIEFDARWPDKPQVSTWQNLSMAVFFGILCILHLVQYIRDKREE